MIDEVTEPARVGSIGFLKHAKCSAGGNPLGLNRQEAMTGLESMASKSSQRKRPGVKTSLASQRPLNEL